MTADEYREAPRDSNRLRSLPRACLVWTIERRGAGRLVSATCRGPAVRFLHYLIATKKTGDQAMRASGD